MTDSKGILFYNIQLFIYKFLSLYFNVHFFPNCDIALYRSSSIRVAHISNHHIIALESDAELFDKVLKHLQTLTTDSKSLDSATTCDGIDLMIILP